jgi:ABC-type amino acid transport substrate-binding protein/cytochrome c553
MATAIAAVTSSAMALAEPLRVCSDPDNLPFSKSDGPRRGLYIELAELVGKRLGMPVEYVWYLTYNQRRALRNSIDGCDAYFALPASPDYKAAGVTRTKPFLDVSYVIASKPDFRVGSLADLKGRRIGVTFSSAAQVVLSNHGGYEVHSYGSTEDAFAAINAGEIDAGLVWGPHAGYLNTSEFNHQWQLTPVAGQGLSGQIAVAVPKGKDALKEKIEAALTELRPEVEQLQRQYGFPTGVPLVFDDKASWRKIAAELAAGHASEAHRWTTVQPGSAHSLAARGVAEDFRSHLRKVNDTSINDYRAMFNSRCSHCHSQNGASPQPERDLRRLSSRYDDKWKDVARATIMNGRSDYGMPAWGASLSTEEIDNLLKFLETIQKKR